jgi:phage terminase large subunit
VSDRIQRVSTGYTPRPIQDQLHRTMRRFNVLVCHRRFGKTVFCINHTIAKGMRNQRKHPRYAYVAPLYGQAKRVAWDYFKQYTEAIPGATSNEADLRVDIPRPALGDVVRFSLLGADNPVALKGIYLDGVTLDEYAEMNPATWREVIRPTLSDRGGWATFIGTPKGQNSFYDLYTRACSNEDPEWFGAMYKASETGILSPEELASAKREMTEEEYEQEFECSFQAGLVGAYYSKELIAIESSGRLTEVPYDPALQVTTYWDLGINDVMAVWFVQQYGAQYRIIDYDESADLSIGEWMRRLNQKPYNYGRFYLPHDASARELGSGRTREEQFRSAGARHTSIVPKQDPLDGIHAVRMILPRCVFDRTKTARGFKALQNYQRKWDPKANVFSQKPMHNWASNGADAFRTFAMGCENYQGPDDHRRALPRTAETEYDVFTHAHSS